MILTVTLNPSVDHVLFVHGLRVGDTNRVYRTERDAGGKGVNVARVYAELGGQATATGFLGGGAGAYIKEVLAKQGVVSDFIEVPAETRVNFTVEAGDGPPTAFSEPGPEISAEAWSSFLVEFESRVRGAAWVTIGGSLPPGVSKGALKTLVGLARELGARVALDADGEPMRFGMEALPNLIKPNALEASRLLGRPVETNEQALDAARSLVELLDSSTAAVILSRGPDGAILATADALWEAVPPKIEACSTIGSGDSLIGAYLWALEAGMAQETALRWGVAAGAATAMTSGSEIARKPVIDAIEPRVMLRRCI